MGHVYVNRSRLYSDIFFSFVYCVTDTYFIIYMHIYRNDPQSSAAQILNAILLSNENISGLFCCVKPCIF